MLTLKSEMHFAQSCIRYDVKDTTSMLVASCHKHCHVPVLISSVKFTGFSLLVMNCDSNLSLETNGIHSMEQEEILPTATQAVQ